MPKGESDTNAQTLAQIESAYSTWGGHLFRFALRLCGNRDDAEDIVVETFAHAYRKWNTFQGKGSRLSWLYGIAVNRYRMSGRSNWIRPKALTEDVPTAFPNVLDRVAIEQALMRMPLEWRESFLLVKSEGLTNREAAEILKRPIGTVLYEVFQAVRFVRKELQAEGTEVSVPSKICEAES